MPITNHGFCRRRQWVKDLDIFSGYDKTTNGKVSCSSPRLKYWRIGSYNTGCAANGTMGLSVRILVCSRICGMQREVSIVAQA